MSDLKKNQSVICINNYTLYSDELTIGKEYIIVDVHNGGGIFVNASENWYDDDGDIGVLVLNDLGYHCYYNPKIFRDKMMYRCKIINDILDEI